MDMQCSLHAGAWILGTGPEDDDRGRRKRHLVNVDARIHPFATPDTIACRTGGSALSMTRRSLPP
ncbi:MAG TPA: hypothetical protein VLQ65_12170, partial [Saliniramus sp.]|nr:hypothetical protein [Saliniramus sp.]